MNEIKVAFYKSESGNIEDYLVDKWSNMLNKILHRSIICYNGFSHVELVFSNGISFSSSKRDGGTRFKTIDYGNNWEIINVQSLYTEDEIFQKAVTLDGLKYDWLGLFLHEFIPLDIEDRKSWWCSEVVCYLLGVEDYNINPNYFYSLIKNNKLTYR